MESKNSKNIIEIASNKKNDSESLKPEHQKFILEYIRTGNAVKSYQSVYPNSSYNAAGVSSHQLLKNPKISSCIESYYEDLWSTRKTEIGRTFDNLLKIANADISNVVSYKDGKMTIRDFDGIDTSIIQQITQTVTDTKDGKKVTESIKLHDRTKAISELIKVLGMINEKNNMFEDIIIISAKRPQELEDENE